LVAHEFLLAAPFGGANTPILDCTVRDKHGNISFKLTLIEIIKTIVDKWFSRKGANYPPTANIPIPTFEGLQVKHLPKKATSRRKQAAKAKPARSGR
jgi:hypothetical protein